MQGQLLDAVAPAPATVGAITIRIPGEPVPQLRPRAFIAAGRVVVTDPPKSRKWKDAAKVVVVDAVEAAGGLDADGYLTLRPLEGPVECSVVAVFTCPRSHWSKRNPLPRRRHAQRPDAENVAKAVLDAATDVLWLDDSQVARLTVEKFFGAQGEDPYVEIRVWPLT